MTRIIAARITENFLNEECLSGVVHSQFSGVLNINFAMPEAPDRLLTVLPPRFTGIPDSLVVSEAYFRQLALLPVGTEVKKKGFIFSFGSQVGRLGGTAACLRRSSFMPEACSGSFPFDGGRLNQFLAALGQFQLQTGRADGLSELTSHRRVAVEVLLQQFGAGLLMGDAWQIAAAAVRCVGLGKGLTPSADDALVGMMAVVGGARAYGCLAGTGWPEKPAPDGDQAVVDNVMAFVASINGRTTDVSLKYLRCAAEGRFSEVLLNLVAALFEGASRNWEGLIAAVAQVGGTSGLDMLHGAALGCRSLLRWPDNCRWNRTL